ncbi:hypothetical protein [Streptomyces pseudovenezuelae]|uniref:Uncharacterized protein n=1 Tax=Streptomyces pseudovenezuelae TaxID=67350 RepID=A0ABT6LTT4_9ACTN|nr:hypothetical protein [Streptomyces pseudovenezuelae]MDH6219713.1 hypothetical protein [Streptomyces pseudovenezuelae]
MTSLAAYFGPLRLHQRQAAVQQQQIEQNARGVQEARRDEQIARLLLVRATSRAWMDAMDRTVQDLQGGRYPDVDQFDELYNQLGEEAAAAHYALARSGIYVSTRPTAANRAPRYSGAALTLLREVTREVRGDVLRCSTEHQGTVSAEVLDLLNRIGKAREGLNAALAAHLERLNGSPLQPL